MQRRFNQILYFNEMQSRIDHNRSSEKHPRCIQRPKKSPGSEKNISGIRLEISKLLERVGVLKFELEIKKYQRKPMK